MAAKKIEPPPGRDTPRRDGTGTPISALVAAEVADSAELLHEEVPEREKPKESGAPHAKKAKPDAILILEPPKGEGDPVQLQAQDFADDLHESISNQSPLFAHECVGPPEEGQEVARDEPIKAQDTTPADAVDPDQIDANDETLEPFPSNRDEIIETVKEIENTLEEDQADFSGTEPTPVIDPNRRATQDITGDFDLEPPKTFAEAAAAPEPTGNTGSENPPLDTTEPTESDTLAPPLQPIKETKETKEEGGEEKESTFRPVVFTNPLEPEPAETALPARHEDEGVALADSNSPRTVKVPAPPTNTEEWPPLSPTAGKGKGLESKDDKSLPEQPPAGPSDQPATTEEKENNVATDTPATNEEKENGVTADTPAASRPRAPSYAQVLASPPPSTEEELKKAGEAIQTAAATQSSSSSADVSSTLEADHVPPATSEHATTEETTEPSPRTAQPEVAEPGARSGDTSQTTTTAPEATGEQQDQPQQQQQQQQQQPEGGKTAHPPAKKPITSLILLLRFVFVDLVANMFNRVAGGLGLFWIGRKVLKKKTRPDVSGNRENGGRGGSASPSPHQQQGRREEGRTVEVE
jgi:hypothetical protein